MRHSSSEYILAENRFGAYCIPRKAAHRPAAQCVINGNVWEEKTIEFMIAKCRDADIVTAGAFFGDGLPALSSATRGTVWAFEPNRENFRCASITILMNDLRNVHLNGVALGEKPDTGHLMTLDNNGRALGGASHIVNSKTANTAAIDIAKLDDLLPPDANISILHLDVERFERFALKGATETIKRCRPILILETCPPVDTEAHQLLSSLNYRTIITLSGNSVLNSNCC